MVQVTENYAAMPSRKHSGRRARTQMLVVHSAEAPLQRGYAKSLTNWSNTTAVEASWNAFADPGVVVRAVNTYYAAWHASWANSTTVGYETAAYAAFTRATWLTLEGRRMLERLAIEMAADAEIFDIPLRWLTGAQVNAVRAGNTTIKGLAAHRQVDPANRTDPGNGFPYGYLLKRIKAHTHGSAAQGPVTEPVDDKVTPIIEKDWFDMATEKDLEQIVDRRMEKVEHLINSRLGDVSDVPQNYGSEEWRKKNPKWFPQNVHTKTWYYAIEAASNAAAARALVEKLAEKQGITADEIHSTVKNAVTEALKESTVDVDIDVQGKQ